VALLRKRTYGWPVIRVTNSKEPRFRAGTAAGDESAFLIRAPSAGEIILTGAEMELGSSLSHPAVKRPSKRYNSIMTRWFRQGVYGFRLAGGPQRAEARRPMPGDS
jgi:hypothetical protein